MICDKRSYECLWIFLGPAAEATFITEFLPQVLFNVLGNDTHAIKSVHFSTLPFFYIQLLLIFSLTTIGTILVERSIRLLSAHETGCPWFFWVWHHSIVPQQKTYYILTDGRMLISKRKTRCVWCSNFCFPVSFYTKLEPLSGIEPETSSFTTTFVYCAPLSKG